MLVGESIRASHETGQTRTCSAQLKVILKGLSQLSIGKVNGDVLERMTLEGECGGKGTTLALGAACHDRAPGAGNAETLH